MKVLVLHNQTGRLATADELDVLVQRDAVTSALLDSGHVVSSLSCNLDLESLRQQIDSICPDVVFNLVESLGGTDRLMPLVPQLLDAMGVRYTGASAQAILATSGKVIAKQILHQAGLPTAAWITARNVVETALETFCESKWIFKPVWEHGSVGMTDDSIITARTFHQIQSELRRRQQIDPHELFAEQFIDGREFNLSLLNGHLLPPAEIEFRDFPVHKPRIVGQRAKWVEDSMEYRQTPRTFDFEDVDQPLIAKLSDLAIQCWQLFQLRGFARVDFRVDSHNQPWVLEVNVNPCLSPDAGFAAALSRAGVTFPTAINEILQLA